MRFWQAALTVQGKIGNFDLTYAGAYMDRPTYQVSDYADYADAYDFLYADYYDGAYGRGLAIFYYLDSAGNRTINPQQYIIGSDHFTKHSQEIRIASPAEKIAMSSNRSNFSVRRTTSKSSVLTIATLKAAYGPVRECCIHAHSPSM